MPTFGSRSQAQLATCHPDLQRVFNKVIENTDCSIIEGFRTEEDQHRDFLKGVSKLDWPNGKHNQSPSIAVDVVPYPIDWMDRHAFVVFAAIVQGVAAQLDPPVRLRWGGAWNGTFPNPPGVLDDLDHFELVEG